MRSRPTPRVLVAIAVSGLLLGAAGCTSSGPDTSRPTLAKATAGTVTVADASDAAARSVRVSKALFASAPGAIVATAGDADAISDAAKAAASAHVPVLLTAKNEQDTKGGAAVARELDRLGADWYQAEGDVSLDTDVDERKAPEGGDAPESTRASRQATVVVADASADAAAVATAKAAGARVVTMPRGVTDPAAAPDVVTALHERAKHPTVLVGAAFDALQDPEWTVRAAEGGFQLRNGGQRPFDGHRYVALYGAPGSPALGVLGEQGPEATVRRAEQVAKPYRAESDELVTPAMEVIATVAAGDAGADGDYSTELPVSTLEPYVDAAHDADMPVIIDLQPGRSDFLSQAKKYESLLQKPGVWLALDPEWRLTKDQVPLQQIGSVSASEVNEVSSWLAALVRKEGLPPKALVLHQFRLSMIQDRSALETHPELDMLVHVDGQGSQPDKQATWKALHQGAPEGLHWGWKNFYDEDTPMLTPGQTMSEVSPTPSLVTYQ
ncbi:ABC-type sugar transport system substrate-binding protein [Curtobacterium sp. PvP017]